LKTFILELYLSDSFEYANLDVRNGIITLWLFFSKKLRLISVQKYQPITNKTLFIPNDIVLYTMNSRSLLSFLLAS
jgi:hypothetical protein